VAKTLREPTLLVFLACFPSLPSFPTLAANLGRETCPTLAGKPAFLPSCFSASLPAAFCGKGWELVGKGVML
jgi:hypothetical protein